MVILHNIRIRQAKYIDRDSCYFGAELWQQVMKSWMFLFFIAAFTAIEAQNNAKYVNVFIGTDGTGHTFPGPSMPFGMVQPGPDNRDQGWNHTSGYQFRDSIIMGFSQTRFSAV